jgi:ZIP family zinc transporter
MTEDTNNNYLQGGDDWKFPLMLSCLAGASTSVGAAIVFLFDAQQIQKSMSFSLSLAASVMITVSVVSLGPECLEGVIQVHSLREVMIDVFLLAQRVFSFALGCFSYGLLSKFLMTLPEPESILASGKSKDDDGDDEEQRLLQDDCRIRKSKEDASSKISPKSSRMRRTNTREASVLSSPSSQDSLLEYGEQQQDEDLAKKDDSKRRSWRVAMLLFVSLLCHNFPEGLAVAASTVESRELGISVAIGIFVHNIPEGIAIAVPCIAARPDAPWLAFWLASASGLAEPLGAIVALCVLRTSKLPLENVLACVAGIMCMVACLELYPEAFRHVSKGNYRSILWGTLVGMAIMLVTELSLP